MDATVAPQNITFHVDPMSRIKIAEYCPQKKSEELIDILYDSLLYGNKKVRT